MSDRRDEDEPIGFWNGWKGLYAFILAYALLQIVLLYIFTVVMNRP